MTIKFFKRSGVCDLNMHFIDNQMPQNPVLGPVNQFQCIETIPDSTMWPQSSVFLWSILTDHYCNCIFSAIMFMDCNCWHSFCWWRGFDRRKFFKNFQRISFSKNEISSKVIYSNYFGWNKTVVLGTANKLLNLLQKAANQHLQAKCMMWINANSYLIWKFQNILLRV